MDLGAGSLPRNQQPCAGGDMEHRAWPKWQGMGTGRAGADLLEQGV